MDANKNSFQILKGFLSNIFWLLLVLLLWLGSTTNLVGSEDLFFAGNARFAEEKYAEAAELYEQALAQVSSANLYYNAGLAALKLNDPGKARLQWERALTLEPRHRQARNSLRNLLADLDLPGSKTESTGWMKAVFSLDFPNIKSGFFDLTEAAFSVNQWFWLGVLSLWVFVFSLLGFWWKRLRLFPWLALGGFAGVILALTVVFHLNQERHAAIVLNEGAELWVAPVPHSPIAGSLRAGERVHILEAREDFFHVRQENGTEGYLKTETIERIF